MPSNMKTPVMLALAAGASVVQAHGYVSSWTIGGTEFDGFDEMWAASAGTDTGNTFIAWSESAQDNGFIAPDAYATPDIICHKDATNGALNTASVAAGGTVTATWNTWPDSHHGPIINYIAAADDPTTVDKTTLEWVKIDESGLISGSNPGTWASDEMIANNLSYDITIPSTLKPGNYVLRHEIIALHSAGESNGAQNYPMCVNLEVTGSGTELPEGTLGTALYTESDTSISFNLYEAFSGYTIPGPALAFSGDSAADPAADPATPATSAAASAATSAAVATSAAAAATKPVAVGAASPTTASTASAAATPSSSSCKTRRHARALKN